MSPAESDDEVDAAIAGALARARDADWLDLWEAVDALAQESTFATWAGGEVVETRVVDGEERSVYEMPYPVYVESVERVRRQIGLVGLIVPFAWMDWDGLSRYRDDPQALSRAPVEDAVRLLTAIVRSERFSEGSIEGALRSGVMQAALARLRRWYDVEHPSDRPSGAD